MNRNLSRLKRSGIRRFTNLAKTVDGCVMLTLGEPDFDTPQAIKAAALTSLFQNETHYAPNQGLETLRAAIAGYETRRGMACEKEQVLVTVGASGALYTALTGILNPGDEVIVPTPAFPLYESIITMAGATLVPLDTKASHFQIDEAALASCVTDKTKAVLLNSPNNPTGVVYTRESLENVKKAILGKPIFLLCDNVYQALSGADVPDLTLDNDLRSQVLLCQSFSKPYAMTGWRLGYLVGEEEVIERLLLLNAAQVASVSTFIQAAGIAALEEDPAPMAQSYRRRREYVCQRLTAMGLPFPEPQGAFYVFPDISRFGLSSEEFCTRLILEGKVAAVPGSCFGCEGHIRISCCCSDSALQTGLDRLEAFISTL